ncbi:16S rRNA (uracil(1498)-N(3))-methyltransferase [Nocardioides mangrovicus]|uniref:Ribosomal RNA small subunit methyltransferase E n=1 Tax=Nocardioides mangrovicus TaxID=2478913 RepID=A0A3L8P3K1_9ACTN|nr:16S rRNA (uracil(1498)-N(3))-methyltransferase [Nocardioides mangrovicus]RLV49587.1 16S rRNA (uracil(1498)-N(3))-methyltransferase [Nocardioides mangrovicus]
MTLPVYVHDGTASLRAGDDVVLDGDEGRHAVTVRRTAAGERVVLTDGAGAAATVLVTDAAKASLTGVVEEAEVRPAEEPRVTVVQAIPKGERADLAVEVLTEVGVDEIVPWAAERCVAVWKGEEKTAKALAKWRATAREAAKQARRVWFPTVAEPATTDDVAALLAGASVPVVLDEAASGPIGNLPIPGRGSIVVVVGPEGGISPAELEAFAAVGAEPVRLGSSVLRTSTAGVAAVAALLARTRRWG